MIYIFTSSYLDVDPAYEKLAGYEEGWVEIIGLDDPEGPLPISNACSTWAGLEILKKSNFSKNNAKLPK
jgi:hypothetical protein